MLFYFFYSALLDDSVSEPDEVDSPSVDVSHPQEVRINNEVRTKRSTFFIIKKLKK